MDQPKIALRISGDDNVAVVTTDVSVGETACVKGDSGDETIQVQEDIPAGHKIALVDLEKGVSVFKYGYPMGKTVCPIAKGCWVNHHNVVGKHGLIAPEKE